MSASKPSNKELSEWYLLLSQQLQAGVTLSQAIQLSGIITTSNRLDIVRALDQGNDVVETFERYAQWMPVTDRSLIAAANQSGKLPETLATLAARRIAVHENINRAVSATIYPIFIVHLAAIVTPVFQLMDLTSGGGNITFHFDRYIPGVIKALGIAWGLIVVAAVLLKQNNPRVLAFFPILRHYSKLQAIADLSGLLGSFVKAGATFETSWREAGNACRDARLREFTYKIADLARQGLPPSDMLTPKEKLLPPEFVSLYISGEQTGQLDKNLDLLNRLFQEKANQKLDQASKWYPVMIFLCVAVYVGWGIANFYMDYLDVLMSIIKPHR